MIDKTISYNVSILRVSLSSLFYNNEEDVTLNMNNEKRRRHDIELSRDVKAKHK